MAVTSDSIEVGTDAIALNTPGQGGTRIIVKNAGVGNKVADLGPGAVTLGAGFELVPGETVGVDLESDEVLYAVSGVEGTTLKVLRS